MNLLTRQYLKKLKMIRLILKYFESEKFYIEKININGNFNTLEEVIRNNLIVDEGDPFNEILFNKSINNLQSLGIFKDVDTNIQKDQKTI